MGPPNLIYYADHAWSMSGIGIRDLMYGQSGEEGGPGRYCAPGCRQISKDPRRLKNHDIVFSFVVWLVIDKKNNSNVLWTIITPKHLSLKK